MRVRNQLQIKDKQSHILQAAVKLFAEKEFRNTSIAEIAKEANVAEGLIYYYFLNKEDILLSIFLSFWQDFNYRIEEILSSLKTNISSSQKLHLILKVLKRILMKDRFSLYLVKVLTESLPHYYLLDKEHSDLEKQLIEKRNQVRLENRKILALLDKTITEGLKDKTNNPKVIRQGLYGAFQMLVYGLFLKGSGREQDIGYNIKDAENFINKLISSFIE